MPSTSYDYTAALQRLGDSVPDAKTFSYFLKVDISGIQDFIFHVQSEKAARTLKGRSFFVQVLGWLAEELVNDVAGGAENCYRVYNGGGNVYLLLQNDIDLTALRLRMNTQLRYFQLYASVSKVPFDPTDFANSRRKLEAEASADKLRKFQEDHAAFTPFAYRKPRQKVADGPVNPVDFPWDVLTKNLLKQEGYKISTSTASQIDVGEKVIQAFDQQFSLDRGSKQFTTKILNKLPTWEGVPEEDPVRQKVLQEYQDSEEKLAIRDSAIREFTALAYQAQARTGTARLGVLKMDVDNLGEVFNSPDSLEAAKQLSDAFTWFFEDRFTELWQECYTYRTYGRGDENREKTVRLQEDLYVVYAGGDDCFVIGGWDVILYFASLVRREFAAFIAALTSIAPALRAQKVTLSAGISVVNRKFPALRFAREAETALEAAKHYDRAKNRITLFGESISWEEFDKVSANAKLIGEMIRDGHYQRSLIQRIKRSAIGYDRLRQRAIDGDLQAPKVWRLYHFLGKKKKARSPDEERAQQKLAEFMQEYGSGLMRAFHEKEKGSSHMIYPLAARWAEFMTARTGDKPSADVK